MKVFNKYAHFYDVLYQDKDYSAECDYLEKIFRKYSQREVKSILDIGCGTGGHAIILAKRGYQVKGIDFSFPMLKIAREKIREENLEINFEKADIRDFNLNKKFDACIAMFAVMGYQTTNKDFADTVLNARKHLKQNGLFIFDVWFGPAVLTQRPKNPVKIIKNGNEKIVRRTHTRLDIINQVVEVTFDVQKIRQGVVIKQAKEIHLMRFFFPQEIEYFLQQNGFRLSNLLPFMHIDEVPSENDWNITIVGMAK